MKVRINLLPHRQIKRAQQKRQFTLMSSVAAAVGLFIVFLGYTYINSDIAAQNSRNQRLNEAISKLDLQIKEIDGLKDKINELKERIQAVESLQHNRSSAVMMLDEIARKLPEAVALKSLRQKGDTITLDGYADTNARVANLVSNLSESSVLVSPQLLVIKTENINNQKVNTFSMTVKLKKTVPNPEDEKKAAAKKGGKK